MVLFVPWIRILAKSKDSFYMYNPGRSLADRQRQTSIKEKNVAISEGCGALFGFAPTSAFLALFPTDKPWVSVSQ